MRERLWALFDSSSKVHNIALLMAAYAFVHVARRCTDATVIAAVGGTFASVFVGNAWAGTRAQGSEKPNGNT